MQITVKLNSGEICQALREFAARKSGVSLDRLLPIIVLDKSRHIRSMSQPVVEVVFDGVIH